MFASLWGQTKVMEELFWLVFPDDQAITPNYLFGLEFSKEIFLILYQKLNGTVFYSQRSYLISPENVF